MAVSIPQTVLTCTHFTKNIEKIVRAEWGYEAIFSSFSSQSRGVAILFKNNFEYNILNSYNDTSGNYLILDLEIDKRRMTLVNLYGPNTDEPNFYDKLHQLI